MSNKSRNKMICLINSNYEVSKSGSLLAHIWRKTLMKLSINGDQWRLLLNGYLQKNTKLSNNNSINTASNNLTTGLAAPRISEAKLFEGFKVLRVVKGTITLELETADGKKIDFKVRLMIDDEDES